MTATLAPVAEDLAGRLVFGNEQGSIDDRTVTMPLNDRTVGVIADLLAAIPKVCYDVTGKPTDERVRQLVAQFGGRIHVRPLGTAGNGRYASNPNDYLLGLSPEDLRDLDPSGWVGKTEMLPDGFCI